MSVCVLCDGQADAVLRVSGVQLWVLNRPALFLVARGWRSRASAAGQITTALGQEVKQRQSGCCVGSRGAAEKQGWAGTLTMARVGAGEAAGAL